LASGVFDGDADFSQSETWAIETTLKERWPEQHIELQPPMLKSGYFRMIAN
jgi:hypothetical protein